MVVSLVSLLYLSWFVKLEGRTSLGLCHFGICWQWYTVMLDQFVGTKNSFFFT